MSASDEQRQESLSRARDGKPNANYGVIIAGMVAKGIPLADIEPRVNVFSYNAWQALNRQVRKGEHGVRISTYIKMSKKDKETGKVTKSGTRPRTCSVFHISQTDPFTK